MFGHGKNTPTLTEVKATLQSPYLYVSAFGCTVVAERVRYFVCIVCITPQILVNYQNQGQF